MTKKPYKPEEERLLKKQISLLPSEWERVEKLADNAGITKTAFCRKVILAALDALEETKNNK